MKKQAKCQVPALDDDVLLRANEVLTKIREPIADSTIQAAQESFRNLLRSITIQTQAQLYTDLTSITMIASAREQARVQMLNRTTTLVQEIQNLLTEEALTIRTESENYGRQFARESAHDAAISDFKKNDPIAHMCHVLSQDIVSAKKVRDLAYDFKNDLQRLKQRFCHEKIRSILEIFTDIVRFCVKFLQDEVDTINAIRRVRESLVSLLVQTTSIQQNKAPSALPKANVPSPFSYATPAAQTAPESVTSYEPNRSVRQEQMTTAQQSLRLNRDNMHALSRATKIPIDTLLNIKNGMQICVPATLHFIIQEAGKLTPLSAGEEEFRGEVQTLESIKPEVGCKFARNIKPTSVKTDIASDPQELISDDGHILGVMKSYGVTLAELFPCPRKESDEQFRNRLQKLEAIIAGDRQCARGKLMILRKNIEDACLQILNKKHANTDVTSDVRGRETDIVAQKRFTDERGTLQRLLKSKKKTATKLYCWMKGALPTLSVRRGNRASEEQRLAMQELSAMELGTLMNIVDGVEACSLNAFKILEDMTKEFVCLPEQPTP